MAYAKARTSGRFSAIYVDHTGKEKSAGTFDSQSKAEAIANAQEAWVRTGKSGVDPARKATMTIEEYGPAWLRNHRVEPSTKTGYNSIMMAHVIPVFGKTRVAELQREQVRSYITALQEKGKSVSLQRHLRAVMSAMMQTAWDDGYRSDNPVRGLAVQRGTRKKITVLTTEQFGEVYRALPSDGARLLSDLIVSTGCRTGEGFALHYEQFDAERLTLTFDRAVQEVKKEFHPTGESRFHLAPYTKTHDHRTVAIPKKLAANIEAWIVTHNMVPGDPLFPRHLVIPVKRERRVRIDLNDPTVLPHLTEFEAANGKFYRHGTMNGYITGKCHCDYCKQGFADYRYSLAQEKRGGSAGNRPDHPDQWPRRTEPYVDKRDWGRVWKAAVAEAEIPFVPTAYQLRHTHASWLIEKGIDPKKVMERLGHSDLSTTSLYTHMLHGSDDREAADMLDDLGDW